MLHHPAIILDVIKEKFVILLICPHGHFCYIFVKSWQMRGNRCMKAWDYFIQNLLLQTHIFELVSPFEAVLLINQWPYVRSVVSWKRLYIGVHVKILTFVVFLIFNVPHPFAVVLLSLFRPHVFVFVGADNFIRFDPVLWDILFIAPAHWTTLGLA